MGARQRGALEALAGAPLGAAALARRTGCTHSTLRSLERRGLIRLESAADAPRRPRSSSAWGAEPAACRSRRTSARPSRRSRRGSRRRRGERRPLLLHGVTGSGKTEVYLRAVAAALERGRSAIVLVPEIALTPQTAGRFVERFGERVAVMHSRLSQRERYDEWWRMRRGEARVCVGPALRRLRAVRRPRADHRRRGARRLLQAGGRPPLRRARRGRAARRRRGRAAAWPGAPRRARRACCATSASGCPRASTAGGCRRWSSWGWRARRARSTSSRARRSTRCAGARRRRSCC